MQKTKTARHKQHPWITPDLQAQAKQQQHSMLRCKSVQEPELPLDLPAPIKDVAPEGCGKRIASIARSRIAIQLVPVRC